MTKFTDNLWRDLAREHGPALAQADRPEQGRARRPRVIAGSTLALAAAGTALGLGLTATSATPALAVTRQPDGSVLVKVNVEQKTQPWVQSADRKLAAMGIDEQIMVSTQPGAATVRGPVSCTPWGKTTPPGPPVKVLLGTNGTQVIPAGITGAGTVHLSGCVYYKGVTQFGSGNTGKSVTKSGSGNTGAG
jgi:hypothetical protein